MPALPEHIFARIWESMIIFKKYELDGLKTLVVQQEARTCQAKL